jgi:hypothetical protein
MLPRDEARLEYTVVRGYGEDFLLEVEEMLTEGWVPHGGVALVQEYLYREFQPGVKHKVLCNYFAQAMVRRKQRE